MKLEVNIEKKYAFAIISILLLIGIGVYAYAYTSPIPNPGHGADTVWVYANGSEMTLQDAITNGKIGGSGGSGGGGVISGVTFTYYCYDNYGLGPVCTDAGGTQGYCPVGFTQKLALGNFGVCFATTNSRMDIFMSPGGTCNNIGGAVGGRAFICSNQTSGSGTSGSIRPVDIDSTDKGPSTFVNAFNDCEDRGMHLPAYEELLYMYYKGTYPNCINARAIWTTSPDDARNGFVDFYCYPNDHSGTVAYGETHYYRCIK